MSSQYAEYSPDFQKAIPRVAARFYDISKIVDMKDWAKRFRHHMGIHGQSQESLGEVLGVTQGAIGHWLRGRNQINLSDFWRLCEAAGAEPKLILFGSNNPALVSEVRQVLEAHPELMPNYRQFERGIGKAKKSATRKVRARHRS